MVVLFMPMPRPSCVVVASAGSDALAECSAMDFGFATQQLVDDPNHHFGGMISGGGSPVSLASHFSADTPSPLPPSRVTRLDQQWGWWRINSRGLPVRLQAGERA